VREALSDAGSAGREGRAYVLICIIYFLYMNIFLSRRSKRGGILGLILFVNTRKNLKIHEQTLGTVHNRGVQADARGATQKLYRGGQAVARGSCLSQVLDRDAEAVARGCTVSCASQVLHRGAQAVAHGAAS
jgi:hypothetical protein